MKLSEAPLLALAVRERQPVACEDAVRQRALPPGVALPLGLCAVIAVPVIEGRRLWGFLLADNGKQPIELSPDDADVALALANQAAMAQGNTFRINDARRWSERLATSARETHHRIRNNLQAICDVLELELMERGGDAWAALEHSLQRVRAIATVHEFLVYHQDPELVDVDQVLQRLVPLVVTAAQRPGQAVQAQVEACPLTQSSKRTTALALVVNELVGNAVRHGLDHDRRSMVKVSLTERGGTICLRVADNGRGLPEGFEVQRDAHLGLEIARTLAERELGGQLVLRRRRGRASGTVASVRFSE
jgi:two-component sensor histidine kinase